MQAAQNRAAAESLRARGEHRAMLPSVDFAAQYGVLATYNNYQQFFQPGSFQRHNATPRSRYKISAFQSDPACPRGCRGCSRVEGDERCGNRQEPGVRRNSETAAFGEQMAAAKEVADLEYQVAQSNLESLRVRLDAGSIGWHDVQDAREQVNERYNSLQDANFELERARITLLRATGELEAWIGTGR